MGRPSKLTPEVHAAIVADIGDKTPAEVAAGSVGITARSYHNWMHRGESSDDEECPYYQFFHDVTRAKSQATKDLVRNALTGDGPGQGNGPAKCAQWMLERTRGKQFAPRVAVKVEEETSLFFEVASRVLPAEHYAALLGALATVDDEGVPTILNQEAAPQEH